jgi:hypothetical protein
MQLAFFFKITHIKMTNKTYYSLILLIITILNFSMLPVCDAQVVDNITNNPLSTRITKPLVWTEEPYGLDAVISVGSFDNYMISSSNGFAETDIIVGMTNPNNFVATDNRVTGFVGSPIIYYTSNAGISWQSTVISSSQGDPVFAADSMGNFYFAVLSSGVRVYKSVNGGASWTNLGNAFSNFNADKEWIWCDQTNGVYKNNVYIAYSNFNTGPGVDVWRSTNNGASWLGPIVLSTGNPGANPGPNIVVGPTGRVYVAWNTGAGAVMKYSDDGGATFGSSIFVAFYGQPGVLNPTSQRYCVKGNIRTNGMCQLAVDLTNGPRKGYVYCQYASNPAGTDIADIFLTVSSDAGLTWSTPVRVNDDITTNDQWMGDVSVDNQGRVWVFWWDSRSDPSNILTETWGAVSTNGGTTFTNFKISNQNFNPNIIKIFQGSEHYYLGDYQGISGRNVTFPCYTGQNNTLQDYVAYLPDYGISFLRPVDTVNHGQTSVNRVRAPMMGPYSGTVTYTATVSPPPAQGTITFNWIPGNVKTYTGAPDSITLNTIVSATVPYATYTINVTGAENGGPRTHTRSWTLVVANIIGVANNNGEVPLIYALGQNYPNPFNPSTVIDYSIPKQSVVNLKVYDVLGKEVAVLANNELKPAGVHDVTFNASELPSGVYYYRLSATGGAGDYTDVRKMILVK